MATIPVSGQNGEAIVSQTIDVRHILETAGETAPDFDGNGRVFEMLNLVVPNAHATQVATVRFFDSDETTVVVTTTQVGPEIRIAAGDTIQMTWARGSGPRFRTNVTMGLSAVSGTVNANGVQASGLLH